MTCQKNETDGHSIIYREILFCKISNTHFVFFLGFWTHFSSWYIVLLGGRVKGSYPLLSNSQLMLRFSWAVTMTVPCKAPHYKLKYKSVDNPAQQYLLVLPTNLPMTCAHLLNFHKIPSVMKQSFKIPASSEYIYLK